MSIAARRAHAAMLSVLPRRADANLTAVVLAGHLSVVGEEEVDGARFTLVALALCRIVVEIDDPSCPSVVQRDVPLADYLRSCPDPLTAAAARIRRHTNDVHASQLRTFVADIRAGIRGVGPSEIAAAELHALDLEGVDIRWLDRVGAHTVHVAFARAAHCPTTLAAQLRNTLVGSYD